MFLSEDIRKEVSKSSKPEKWRKGFLVLNVFGRHDPKFSRQFVSAIYFYRFAKFGWVLFADLRVQS